MGACDEYELKILRYLENGLQGRELDELRAHLAACSSCRASLGAEQALSRRLHQSRPLHSAPASLRARVSAIERSAASTRKRPVFGFRALAFALVVVALCLVIVPSMVREARAENYVEAAVAAHQNYLKGDLPVGFRSDSPESVSAWLTGRLPFRFRLPDSQATARSVPAYRLTGASLVTYRGGPAALVTYEKQNDKISLLVASSKSALVYGGDEVRSGKITFHYRTAGGFHVITWSIHGLSYAVVSSVSASPRESCLICHQGLSDRGNFKPGL